MSRVPNTSRPLEVGDTVAYTRNALMTMGGQFCGLRGEILSIVEHSPGWILATVAWKINGGASVHVALVNIRNLCRPRSVAFVELVH